MPSFLLILPLPCFFLYLSLIYESVGFALLGYSVALCMAFSFLFLCFVRKKVSAELNVPLKVADRGQPFGLRIQVKNRSRIPLGKVLITVTYGENQMIAREKMRIPVTNVAKGMHQETRKISIGYAGYYEFTIPKIRIYDPFGFFYLTKREKNFARIMILPKLEEVPVRLGEGVRHFYGETVDYDESMPGKDPSEVFGVREFRDGDKLQRIHWKLSARTEELMVKEDSLPKACAIVLFMPEESRSKSRNLDYLASLSFTLTEIKQPHYVAWYSQGTEDVTRMRVDDEESFYEALTTCLQDGCVKEGENRVERYREKYKGQQFLHSVRADANGDIWIDESQSMKPEEFREELFLR